MFPEDLLIILLIAVIGLDNTHFFQGNLVKPIVSCTLLGFIVGEPMLGLMTGAVFQAMWLAVIPVGGTFFPEGGMATMYGFYLLYRLRMEDFPLDTIFFPVVLFIVLVALLGGGVTILLRRINTRLLILHEERDNFWRPSSYILFGLGAFVVAFFLFFTTLIQPGLFLLRGMSESRLFTIPAIWTALALTGSGIALLIHMGEFRRYRLEAVAGLLSGGLAAWLIV